MEPPLRFGPPTGNPGSATAIKGVHESHKKLNIGGYLCRQEVFRLAIDVHLLKSEAGMRKPVKTADFGKTRGFWQKPQFFQEKIDVSSLGPHS